ncbi:hypothetical protein NQT62_03635 [Limnobacter humi]|uniref:Uncharacterized protein n=1 Tax=Limnobacter humi TaxID=1778671 RepID=A0ABT1WDC8_9BURK|nr:hypothetical protein [Limnobacter humi]MCQ8895532.1 hypothetical protein [Limnobacter humi]
MMSVPSVGANNNAGTASLPAQGFGSVQEFRIFVSALSFRPDMALLYEILGFMERSGVNMQHFLDKLNLEIMRVQKDANRDRMWGQIAGAICSLVISTAALGFGSYGYWNLMKGGRLGKDGDSYVSNGTATIQIANLFAGLGQSAGQVPTAIMERKAADQEADAQFVTRAYQAILEAYQKNYGLGSVVNGAISA